MRHKYNFDAIPGLSSALLARSFFRNRHNRRLLYKSGRRKHIEGPSHRAWAGFCAREEIRKARAAGFRGFLLPAVKMAEALA